MAISCTASNVNPASTAADAIVTCAADAGGDVGCGGEEGGGGGGGGKLGFGKSAFGNLFVDQFLPTNHFNLRNICKLSISYSHTLPIYS